MREELLSSIRVEDFSLKEGMGLAWYKGEKLKIKGGIPEEVVELRVERKKGKFLEGKIVRVVHPSPYRVKPFCPHFSLCGGCQLQHIDYSYQLELKRKSFIQGWESKISLPEIRINPSPLIHSFRNKMEFVFGKDGRGEKALGLHPRGKFWEVVNLSICPVFSDKLTPYLFQVFRNFMKDNKLSVYNPETHEGILRHLVVKEGKFTQELLLGVVAQEEIPLEKLIPLLKKTFPTLVGIIFVLNRSLSDAVKFEDCRVIWGREYLEERLDEFIFRITLPSFFQTNPRSAIHLYRRIQERVKEGEKVLDLYAGMSTIGTFISGKAKEVIAVEENLESIKWGKINASINRCENKIKFFPGRVEEFIKKARRFLSPHNFTTAILDPPRSGLSPRVVKVIQESRIPLIIYVSCNPEKFSRDAKYFLEREYHLSYIELFDFFPHTPHFEVMGEFVLR